MTPTLYCLMREDLQDLNPGKAMAQAMHAQADFDKWVEKHLDSRFWPFIDEWKEGRSFGRTLVLESTLENITDIVSCAHGATAELPMALTVDPTYPWRNFYGKVFLSQQVTCGWVFACELTPKPILDKLRKLSLHR